MDVLQESGEQQTNHPLTPQQLQLLHHEGHRLVQPAHSHQQQTNHRTACCTTKGIASYNLHTVTSNKPITGLLVAPQRASYRATCTQSPATGQSPDCLLHHKGHHVVQPAHSHQQQTNHWTACCTTKGIASCNLHSHQQQTNHRMACCTTKGIASCNLHPVTSNRPITGLLAAPHPATSSHNGHEQQIDHLVASLAHVTCKLSYLTHNTQLTVIIITYTQTQVYTHVCNHTHRHKQSHTCTHTHTYTQTHTHTDL